VSLKSVHKRAVREPPELNRAVQAGRGGGTAIHGHSDAPDGLLMRLDGLRDISARDIPDIQHPVGPAGNKGKAAGGERDGVDAAGVSPQDAAAGPGLHVPDAYGFQTAGGYIFPVGRELHAIHAEALPHYGIGVGAAGNLPHLHGLVAQ